MDFNTLKNYNWDDLKRNDLGATYRQTFYSIYSSLFKVQELLVAFERSYKNFLDVDKELLNPVYKQLINLIKETQDFNIGNNETTLESTAKANKLLIKVKDFYSIALSKISPLQIYLKNDVNKNLEDRIQLLANSVEANLKNKLAEIEQANKNSESHLLSLYNESNRVLNEKFAEIESEKQKQLKQTTDFLDANQTLLNHSLSELAEKVEKATETVEVVEELKNNIIKLNESTQNFSLTKTMSEYGLIFEEQSKNNYRISQNFGIAFIVSIVMAVIITLTWFLPLVEHFSDPSSVTRGIEYYILAFGIRLIVLSFCYWVISEFLKNYNTNYHLYNLNIHRANSLKSFEIIVRNNVLPENRDEIVKQIAQTIFAQQDDGILSSDKIDKKGITFADVVSLVSAVKK